MIYDFISSSRIKDGGMLVCLRINNSTGYTLLNTSRRQKVALLLRAK